jgi:RNA polymerase sigma factor (sigma-70 family)
MCLNEFVQQYNKPLRGFVCDRLRRCGVYDQATADDIVQQTWEQFITAQPDMTTNASGLLFTIARRRVIDWQRSRPRAVESYDDDVTDDLTPLDTVLAIEDQEVMHLSLACLSETERELIRLNFLQNQTLLESAQTLALPVSSAHAMRAKALAKMQRFMRNKAA